MDHQTFAQLLGNYGEFFGSIAVFATLFYLAVQTRRATEVNRTRTFQEIFDSITSHNNVMWSAENAELMISGLASFDSLSPVEKGRFDNLLANSFNNLEASALAQGEGLLDEVTMDNWSWYVRSHLLVYPGVREWWEVSNQLYPAEIRDWVNVQIAATRPTDDFYGLLARAD